MTEEQNKLAERGVKMLTEEHLAKAICLYNGIALQGPDGSEQWWPFCSDAKRMLANADGQLERELAALRVEREPATEAVLRELLDGWQKVLEVDTPTEGIFDGKFMLWHVHGTHRHALAVANNSYDDAALNTILGLLEATRAALKGKGASQDEDAKR